FGRQLQMPGVVEPDRAGIRSLLSPQGKLGMAREKIAYVLQPGIGFATLDVRMAFRALAIRDMGQKLPPSMLPMALRASLRRGMGRMMVRPSVTGGAGLIADRIVAGISP